ncbi:MAG: hypothetical protein WC462_02240 [archaeon]
MIKTTLIRMRGIAIGVKKEFKKERKEILIKEVTERMIKKCG